jgi:hypothetical protein
MSTSKLFLYCLLLLALSSYEKDDVVRMQHTKEQILPEKKPMPIVAKVIVLLPLILPNNA